MLILPALIIWGWVTTVRGVLTQQTLYSYEDSKLYVRLTNNELISVDFDQKFSSATGLASGAFEKLESPAESATLLLIGNHLYSFYNDNDDESEQEPLIAVSKLTNSTWEPLQVSNSFQFYNGSTYLSTNDNTEKVYIYGGVALDNSSDVSSRMLEFDVLSNTFNDNISSSVTPTNFYGLANLLINYNTQLVIGGKLSNGWVSLNQLLMWQYESWSFKSVSADLDINSRKYLQLLPIFSTLDSQEIQQSSSSGISIEGALLIGGQLIDDYSTPKIIRLNVSDTASKNGWSWTSLDDDLDTVDLDSILGTCMVYNTLITFTGVSSSKKRSSDTTGYTIDLYDVSGDVGEVSSVDYTAVKSKKTSKSSSNSNKSAVIAVSVVIPVLVVLFIVALLYLYIRHKKSKDLTTNYESFDIMDLYNNLSKKNSVNYGHEEVKVNNYDDNDNLSINSWRRKREEFDRAINNKNKRQPVRELPLLPAVEEAETPQRNQSIIKRSLSSFSKTFSLRKTSERGATMLDIMEERRPYGTVGGDSESFYNEKSRSTLQFIEEDYRLKHMSDSRSILSATTYYEDAGEHFPVKESPVSVNKNRFSDMTMVHGDKIAGADEDEDINDIDVQVLVSSKRRSKLRVVNPDIIQDDAESVAQREEMYLDENELYMNELFEVIEVPEVEEGSTRKRVVSGESERDESG